MDYIIKDGWIVNGKKEKPFHGDLVIENGKIGKGDVLGVARIAGIMASKQKW